MFFFQSLNKTIQLIMAALGVMGFLACMYSLYLLLRSHSVFIILFVFLSPVFYWFTTPLFTYLKVYHYYSPIVMSYKNRRGILEIHLGTNIDFIIIFIQATCLGISPRTLVKKYFIEGCLAIMKDIKLGRLNEATPLMTITHLINQHTTDYYGLQLEPLTLIEKLEYYYYSVDILWMHIMTCGFKRLTRIYKVSKAYITPQHFLKKEKYFTTQLALLESTNSLASFTISHYVAGK